MPLKLGMTEFAFSSKTLRVFDTKSGYISCCWETIGHRGFGFNLELNQNMSRFCSDFFQIMADQICIWPWSSVETLVLSFCKKKTIKGLCENMGGMGGLVLIF